MRCLRSPNIFEGRQTGSGVGVVKKGGCKEIHGVCDWIYSVRDRRCALNPQGTDNRDSGNIIHRKMKFKVESTHDELRSLTVTVPNRKWVQFIEGHRLCPTTLTSQHPFRIRNPSLYVSKLRVTTVNNQCTETCSMNWRNFK